MPYASKEARALYAKSYAETHREERNAYFRQYFLSHERTLRSRWGMFVWRAAKKGQAVDLSFEDWTKLITNADCHYCGEKITHKSGCSLDRKDSDLGYSLDNVVPCCVSCNRMKNNILTYEEMVYVMSLLVEFRKRKVN